MIKLRACSSLTMVWRKTEGTQLGSGEKGGGAVSAVIQGEEMLATRTKEHWQEESSILKTDSTGYKHKLDWV